LNTYEERQAQFVEDFINTYDPFLDEPEHLREPNDVHRFLESNDIQIQETVTHSTLQQVRDLRTKIRALWLSETLDDLAEELNPLLGKTQISVQVEPDGTDLTLRFDMPEETPLIQRLAIECARGLIALVQHYGLERMRYCAADPCQDVFVDTSRNKSRRFCSDRCANRYNVAAYRDRQKDAAD
jgi:predicted RNA-binding Zn ribbon-like protein